MNEVNIYIYKELALNRSKRAHIIAQQQASFRTTPPPYINFILIIIYIYMADK